jgi:AraC family transcriptional regulator, regulatory protein of adaptative response / methylated-DNA-[protein]-cysteine methyltransferase
MLQTHNDQVKAESRTDPRYASVLHRDRSADGLFVYAVSSTRIFCRPSCPSRKPALEHVRFFTTTAAAERAGFRACKRCRPTAEPRRTADEAIHRVTQYLVAHADERVTLATLARVSGISAFHLQRRFKQALGVSPREYQAACRATRFRQELRAGRDVAAATYESGYGSPSRVYDASPTGRGMSPATYRRGGAGARVGFATVRVPLGWLLVAATATGICSVKLGDRAAALEDELRQEFPRAQIDQGVFVKPAWVRAIVAGLGGAARVDLPLDVRGTAFQWRVWRALQQIPRGATRSYSEIARAIGKPEAVRAVARACATNPVCLVIPCHRVVAQDGGLGGYRWGVTRKARLLAGEKSRKRAVTK